MMEKRVRSQGWSFVTVFEDSFHRWMMWKDWGVCKNKPNGLSNQSWHSQSMFDWEVRHNLTIEAETRPLLSRLRPPFADIRRKTFFSWIILNISWGFRHFPLENHELCLQGKRILWFARWLELVGFPTVTYDLALIQHAQPGWLRWCERMIL